MHNHHAPQLGGAPILDAGTLHSLANLARATDPKLVGELIDLYIEDASQRVVAMRHDHESGRLDAVARAAHTLRSASANVGALAFAAKCREIETSVREGELVDAALATAMAMFDEVCQALSQHRPQRA